MTRWSCSGSSPQAPHQKVLDRMSKRRKIGGVLLPFVATLRVSSLKHLVMQMNLTQIDITDIAWSPDDLQLASCSVDNEILVWDTVKNCMWRRVRWLVVN